MPAPIPPSTSTPAVTRPVTWFDHGMQVLCDTASPARQESGALRLPSWWLTIAVAPGAGRFGGSHLQAPGFGIQPRASEPSPTYRPARRRRSGRLAGPIALGSAVGAVTLASVTTIAVMTPAYCVDDPMPPILASIGGACFLAPAAALADAIGIAALDAVDRRWDAAGYLIAAGRVPIYSIWRRGSRSVVDRCGLRKPTGRAGSPIAEDALSNALHTHALCNAYAEAPPRATSNSPPAGARSSPAVSCRAQPAPACVRSVEQAPRNPPEKLLLRRGSQRESAVTQRRHLNESARNQRN